MLSFLCAALISLQWCSPRQNRRHPTPLFRPPPPPAHAGGGHIHGGVFLWQVVDCEKSLDPSPTLNHIDMREPERVGEHKFFSGEIIRNGNSFGPEHFLWEHHRNKQGPNDPVYRHNLRTLQMMFSVLFLLVECVSGLSMSLRLGSHFVWD